MPDSMEIRTVNFMQVKQALRDAPELAFRFVGGDMRRAATKFRSTFIKERMKGQGINWSGGKKSVGGNVRAFTSGRQLRDLQLVVKISKLLRVHEEGATIQPRNARALFLSRKTGNKNTGQIFARRQSVRIPARLGFVATFDREEPAIVRRIHDAFARALRVAMERRLKTIREAGRSVARLAG